MKLFSILFLFLNFLLINSQNLRNLALTMNQEKLQFLSDIANNTVFQLFELKVDFKGRGFAKIEDDEKKVEVAIYDDQEIPDVEEKFRFDIKYWSPIIPEITMTSSKIDLFGETFDVKEQYKQMANSIANSIENGFVIYYQKSSKDILASTRYKCFVNDENGRSGSFEISVADKNDYELLNQSLNKWIEENKNNENLKKYMPIVSGVLCLKGLAEDIYRHHKKKNISSFLKIPYFSLLLILGLL